MQTFSDLHKITDFRKKPLVALISAACLQLVYTQASAAPCPAAVSGTITVGIAVDATCTVGAGEQIQVTGAGSIALANQFGHGIQVNAAVAATSINNAGTIDSPYSGGNPDFDAIHLGAGASLSSGIVNSGAITANRDGIVLDGATVNGGIQNSSTGVIQSANFSGGSLALYNNAQLFGGVDNSGAIKGEHGIAVYSGSTINGVIHNQVGGQLGDPQEFGFGILVQNSGHISGSILNEGSIDGGEGAITFDTTATMTGNITNTGTISGGAGITFSGNSVMTGSISNSGTIFGDDAGIRILSSGMTGSITNTGSITTLFGGAIFLDSSSTLTGNIDNQHGALLDGGESAGINITGTSTLTGSILNEGTITAGMNSTAAVNINHSTVTGTLNNSGTISDTDTGFGIAVANGANLGALINSGSVTANGIGINIDASTITQGITNSGAVSGQQGIVLTNGATITNGGIVNSNHITGSSIGIALDNSTLSGGITNSSSGQITGLSQGISISSSTVNGNIDNSGIIDGLVAIWIRNTTMSGDIINRSGGSITDSISGYAILINGAATIGNISNSGIITGTNGIGIVSGNVTGSIANNASGIITANNGDGIQVSGAGASAGLVGSIANSGTITGKNGIRINAGSVSGAVANTASGVITASTGDGIQVSSTNLIASVVGSIANSGSITGVNGIRIDNATISAAIANNTGGVITASGNGIQVTNTEAGTSLIDSINNGGTINAAQGIAIDAGATVSHGINNTGILNGTTGGIAIATGATLGGGIDNSGTLAGGSGAGIVVHGANFTGNIANSGTISGANAIDLSDTEATITIDNSGTLDGAVLLGAQTLNLNGNNSHVNGAVTGAGSTVNVNGTFTSANNFEVGNFNIAASGIFNAANPVTASSGMQNLGTLAIKSAQPFALTGDYTQSADGIFLMRATSPTVYDKMTVSGSATLAPLTHITVDVTQGATLIPNGVLPGVITASSLSASTFTVTDNSVLFNFVGVVNGNAVDLNVLPGLRVYDTVVENNNFPGSGAAKVLDQLIQGSTATGDMTTVITALGTLTTSKQVSDAVQQTLPVMTGGTTTAVLGALDAVGKIVQARQESNLGLSSGDGFLTDKSFWLKPFGSWSGQSDRRGVAGYDANGGGLAAGADGVLSDVSRLGFAIAYARTSVDSNSDVAPQSADIDTYQVVMYGSHTLAQHTDLNYQIDFGENKTDADRDINFGGLHRRADANYSGWSAHLGAGIGHVYMLNTAATLTPSVRVDYAALKNRSYTESGAGALNLNVAGQTSDQLVLGVDAKFNYQLQSDLIFTANIGAGYDTYNRTNSVTAAYVGGGGAFVTEGLDPSPWIERGGLGVTYKKDNGMELSGRYDIEARPSDFHDQTVSLKFRMPF